jgi:hypothetical protein
MELGLALSLGVARPGIITGPTYDPAAVAAFARMTVQPDTTRKQLISDFISGVKADGDWSRFIVIGLLASHDAQALRINLVQNLYDATAINAPSVITDRSVQSDGSSSFYDTGFVFPAGMQDDAHMGYYSRSAAQAAAADMGTSTSAIVSRNASDQIQHRMHASAAGSSPNADGSGHFISSRTGALSTDNKAYRNGVPISGQSAASAAPGATSVRWCGRSGTTSYSSRPWAFGHAGFGLSAAAAARFSARVLVLLTAIGAN